MPADEAAKSDNEVLRELVKLTRDSTGTVRDKLKEIGEEIDDVRNDIASIRNVLNGSDSPGYIARTYALERAVEKLEGVADKSIVPRMEKLEKGAESAVAWRLGLMGSIIVLLIGTVVNMALHFAK